MFDCHKIATPIERVDVSDHVEYSDMNVPYREAVGSLLYLAMGTHPDIAYAVSIAAQAAQNPTSKDWCLVKRMLRYVKGTLGLGITYHSSAPKGMLYVYSDADFAGNVSDRKSTTGVVCMHINGAVLQTSQKQKQLLFRPLRLSCTLHVKQQKT